MCQMCHIVSDLSVMDGDSDEIKEQLKLQFQALQEQQVLRIQRRLEMKKKDSNPPPLSSLDIIHFTEEDDDTMDQFNARYTWNMSSQSCCHRYNY